MDKAAFSDHLGNIFSDGLVFLSIGLGNRLGFFKLLCEADKPLSMQHIAETLNLKERYVKEWLSCMLSAQIIQQDRDTELYYVAESHKKELKVRSSFAPVSFELCGRGEAVENCFRKDGPYGFSYDENPTFFDWFNNYRDNMGDMVVDNEILPKFRMQGLESKLIRGIHVLDLGCGTGTYTICLAKRFPKSTFIGMEYSNKGLSIAKATLDKEKLENVSFEFGDAHAMSEEWTSSFDLVFVYDVLHDLPDPDKCLGEIYRIMKDDGCLSMVEMGFHADPQDNIGNKTAAMYYTMSMFICLPSSMSCEPHYGYGAVWGMENIEKALEKRNFKIDESSTLRGIKNKAFYYCTK